MILGNWSPGAKTLTLTVDGAAVNESAVSVTLTDDMNGTEDPKLGSTCAALLTLVIQKPAVQYAGKSITAAVAGIPLGAFTVTSVEAKDERAEIVAIDAMGTAFEGTYTPAAASSTALTVVKDICAACGVPVGDVSDVADVPVSGLAAGQTCREMLGLMAALLGRNAHIDREGKLTLRWYEDSGVTVTADDYYPGELTKQDADYGIDRIECTVRTTTVRQQDGTTSEETETAVYAAGEGTTGISITDDYMTREILDGVFARVGGLTYRPMTVSFYGDARIETGDLIHVTDAAGATYAVPVMKVVHVWDGGVKTTVTAFGNPAEGLSRSSGGYLSKSVSNLMAEFARFQTLEAENVRALNAKIDSVDIDDARIRNAIAETLQAEGINADWINAGAFVVKDPQGREIFRADRDNNGAAIGRWEANYTVGLISEQKIGASVSERLQLSPINEDGYSEILFYRQDDNNADNDIQRHITNRPFYSGYATIGDYTGLSIGVLGAYSKGGKDAGIVFTDDGKVYIITQGYGATYFGDLLQDVNSSRKAIKSVTRSGTTFTYTCLDGTTGTFTQQDNNTWRGIQNNLTSTSTTDSLSAYQGKLLNDNKLGKGDVAAVVSVTKPTVSGVTLSACNVYQLGKICFVTVEFTMTETKNSWTTIATGMPKPVVDWVDTIPGGWGNTHYRHARIRVSGTNLQIAYGTATSFRISFSYPVA